MRDAGCSPCCSLPIPLCRYLVSAAEGRGPGSAWLEAVSALARKPLVPALSPLLCDSVRPPTVLGVLDDRVAVLSPWPAPPARLLSLPRVPPGTEPLGSLGCVCFSPQSRGEAPGPRAGASESPDGWHPQKGHRGGTGCPPSPAGAAGPLSGTRVWVRGSGAGPVQSGWG